MVILIINIQFKKGMSKTPEQRILELKQHVKLLEKQKIEQNI